MRRMVLVLTWGLLSGLVLQSGAVEITGAPLRPAQLQSRAQLASPHALLQTDSTLACFEGYLTALLNPGCFETLDPPHTADCVSASSHFMVQYLFPDVTVTHKVIGFGFLSNDDDTVFPSAGVLQLPIVQGQVRFPSPAELADLPVKMVETFGDTSLVFVDIEAQNLLVQPGANTALVLALQFPQGGDLTAVGVGPGIAADADYPELECDIFTLDGGTIWFESVCSPTDPTCEPLDWGFVLLMEPVLPVESITWSQVKNLFKTP